MQKTFIKTLSLGAALLLSTQAFAQTDAPAAEAAPPAPAAEVAMTAEPTEVSVDSSADVAQTEPTTDAAPMDAEDEPISGWFRVDTDGLGTQLWFGATHSLGGIDIGTDIYVVGAFAEFDIGPVLTAGDWTFLPMVGVGFDFASKNTDAIIAPQLFTIWASGDLYFENWLQLFAFSPFNQGGADDFYVRAFFLYSVSDHVALGPQVELWYALSDTDLEPGDGREKGVSSLPIGGRMNLNYGENNTLGLFLGVETNDNGKGQPNDRALAGRFTFIRTW